MPSAHPSSLDAASDLLNNDQPAAALQVLLPLDQHAGVVGSRCLVVRCQLQDGFQQLFGVIQPDSAPLTLASVPEFFWELSLGIYLVVKGFTPAAVDALPETPELGSPKEALLPLVVEQLAQQHQIPTTVGILTRYLKKRLDLAPRTAIAEKPAG